MWKSKNFKTLVEKISSSPLVDEIIIISNDVPLEKINNSKVKLLQQKQNLGVNPSWNLGVEQSRNNLICFANDDIDFDINIFNFINDKLSKNVGMLGLSLNEDPAYKKFNLKEITERPFGFGCLFFLHKQNYVRIPESFKIFFGDDWLFTTNKHKKNYCFFDPSFKTEMSTTSRYFSHVFRHEQNNYFIELNKININPVKYSIIVPHYQNTISDDVLNRGLNSLLSQTYDNYEIILIHDGPINRKLEIPNSDKIKTVVTDIRFNDWGHSLRDLGIKICTGDYIIHFNPDNILYKNALKEITETVVDQKYRTHNNNIIIFPIYLMGYTALGDRHIRLQEYEEEIKIPLVGNPAILNYIDCMQLVMKKYIWQNYGGWYNKSFAGDGIMYERFVKENQGARYCSNILGEHR